MNKHYPEILLGISITILIIILVAIYFYYKDKQQYNEAFEDFKEDKSKSNVCLKPFSVTCDKDKIYGALLSFQNQIDEIEFTNKTSNKKYDTMYEWYKQKTDKDKAAGQATQDAMKAKLQKTLDNQLNSAQDDFAAKNKATYDKKTNINPSSEDLSARDILKNASNAGDADDQKDVLAAMKTLNLPPGF